MKAFWRKKIEIVLGFCLPALLLTSQYSSGDAQTKSVLSRDGGSNQTKQTCLPTGVCLDAAGRSFPVGNMPLAMTLAPEGDRFVVSLSGWREQGLQVVERETGKIVQTLTQPSAFLGLVFSPDGETLYASGGNEDVVYVYSWLDKQAALIDKIILAPKEKDKDGTRFSAGIASSVDGKKLYVVENLGDSLAVVDVESKRIEQRLPTETYPYAVVVAHGGKIYVSAWGGNTVSVFEPGENGLLEQSPNIRCLSTSFTSSRKIALTTKF